MAWRYEFYLLVMKSIFYSFATLIRKIFFSSLKDKIHIVTPLSSLTKISLWRRANARNVRLYRYYPYWQYTNLFIFQIILYHDWFGFFCSLEGYNYISYWLPSRFIGSQRPVLHLTATHVNKQYICEPHQSWYKYKINTENGGFKPTFLAWSRCSRYLSDLFNSWGGFENNWNYKFKGCICIHPLNL